jgi:predicted RNA-binding Zn-ribbon protein involved in translation (DUF1610 family)
MQIETNMRLSKMEVEICTNCKKEISDDNDSRYYTEDSIEPLCPDCAMEIERQMFL